MNRTKMNREALAINQQKLSHIEHCEARLPGCNGFCARTIAHRKKRRHYRSVEELTDMNEIAIIGAWCHDVLERDPGLTEEVFRRIRG